MDPRSIINYLMRGVKGKAPAISASAEDTALRGMLDPSGARLIYNQSHPMTLHGKPHSFPADDFRIVNGKDRYIGSLTTYRAPDPNTIGVLTTSNVLGEPNMYGPAVVRDLARQLKSHYGELYPGETFDKIGGLRLTGARERAFVQDTMEGKDPDASMRTRFAPAITGAAVGAEAYGDWPRVPQQDY